MKEIQISARRQKTELKWLAGCFCTAFLLNILAIVIYRTAWPEVYTQLLWVMIIAGVLYCVSALLRGGYSLAKHLFVKK